MSPVPLSSADDARAPTCLGTSPMSGLRPASKASPSWWWRSRAACWPTGGDAIPSCAWRPASPLPASCSPPTPSTPVYVPMRLPTCDWPSIKANRRQDLTLVYMAMAAWGASYALNDAPMEALFADSTPTVRARMPLALTDPIVTLSGRACAPTYSSPSSC